MSKVRVDRLRKLVDHLLHGKLGHAKFDFRKFNQVEPGDGFDENGCGTVGCAIGECPIAFPNEWKFDKWKDPILESLEDKLGCVTIGESGMAFFGVNEEEFDELFMPDTSPQVTDIHLSSDATKEEVAERILKFCDIKEQENE